MNKLFINLVIVAATAAVCCATNPPVKQCKGQNFEGLEERIKVDPCSSSKCKLPREANITVAFRFTSPVPVKKLHNNVNAFLTDVGLELPFVGTTGTSACKDVRLAATDKPASCPLEAGVEYIYKNVFYIYPIYPLTDLTVHWSLDDGDRQVICFEVPAAIVKALSKKKGN